MIAHDLMAIVNNYVLVADGYIDCFLQLEVLLIKIFSLIACCKSLAEDICGTAGCPADASVQRKARSAREGAPTELRPSPAPPSLQRAATGAWHTALRMLAPAAALCVVACPPGSGDDAASVTPCVPVCLLRVSGRRATNRV